MFQQCKKCLQSFEVTAEDLDFLEKVSPRFNKEIYQIPAPQLCPDCRLQKRMLWRNEVNLFQRKCSKTKEKLISCFPENTAFPVYKNSQWWSDENDSSCFGKDLDFNRSVFEQIQDLRKICPRLHTFNYADDRMINSLYTNCGGDLKNCYFTFGADRDENCAYCNYVSESRDCFDCFFVFKSECCYECTDLDTCNFLYYSSSCKQCFDSYYLNDCGSCSECIGCVGLRQKKNHILNQPATKEDYKKLKNLLLSDNQKEKNLFLEKYQQLLKDFPRRNYHGDNNENSTGDYIWNTKNCLHCFDTQKAEDCKYCVWFMYGKNCMDYFAWGEAELCYQISGGGQEMYGSAFTAQSFGVKSSYYLDLCLYCKDCFACVGLKNKQYCILNKQYSKEEYQELLPQVIDLMKRHNEWGEYFPDQHALWGYNHTVAADYFPLTKENALFQGFLWNDYQSISQKIENAISAKTLPFDIKQVKDDILQQVLLCPESNKPYKITSMELDFYRKNSLPLPQLHPEIRYRRRFKQRNPRKIKNVRCAKCQQEIFTSYGPEQKVYCTPCYLELLY